MEKTYIECQCDHANHVIRVVFDPDDGDVYIETRLAHPLSLRQRLRNAVIYLLGRDVSYGMFDVTLLRVEDYDAVRDLLSRSELTKAAKLSRERKQGLLNG